MADPKKKRWFLSFSIECMEDLYAIWHLVSDLKDIFYIFGEDKLREKSTQIIYSLLKSKCIIVVRNYTKDTKLSGTPDQQIEQIEKLWVEEKEIDDLGNIGQLIATEKFQNIIQSLSTKNDVKKWLNGTEFIFKNNNNDFNFESFKNRILHPQEENYESHISKINLLNNKLKWYIDEHLNINLSDGTNKIDTKTKSISNELDEYICKKGGILLKKTGVDKIEF